MKVGSATKDMLDSKVALDTELQVVALADGLIAAGLRTIRADLILVGLFNVGEFSESQSLLTPASPHLGNTGVPPAPPPPPPPPFLPFAAIEGAR